ncbi:hypothetical protein CBS147352_11124 [Aspergillus niger]|nr:hypothetical protein CBS147324_10951 [Aspergillus niger]KAI3037017.1 hypothetical protein CBS147352_11124 [Aspergillus niger]
MLAAIGPQSQRSVEKPDRGWILIASSPSTLNSEHSPPLSGVHNGIPVDPVILADDGPWMIGELQSMHPENYLIGSETSFPYPDPPVALCDTSVYHSDSNTEAERQDSDLRSVSPHGQGHTRTPCDNAEANISPRDSPPEPFTSSQRSKLRKRKSQPTGKQPSKRTRHPISNPEEDTSSSALCTHYLSASANEQLQFLSWLFQGAARRTFVELGTEMSMNKGEKPAGEVDHPPSRLEHRGTSRRGKKWSSEEVAFLQELRSDKSKSWSEVTRLFSIRYPGRSRGSIQVYWSTKQGT